MSLNVTYLGHSTTVIELDGVRLITDPVLNKRIGHLLRIVPTFEAGDVDAVLISHGHLDHLHRGSLRRFRPATPVVVPRGLGAIIRSYGFEQVRELDVDERIEIGGVGIRATRADHGGRSLPGRSEAAVGYVVTGTEKVYFAGDTDLFDEMTGLVPELDLALIPIWGWGPSLGPGHLDPERAAEAVRRLAPRIAIPIHWGTLRPFYRSKNSGFLHEPIPTFLTAAADVAPEVDVRVLAPGESLAL